MAVLQLISPSGANEQFPLQSERAVMGRHPDCDLVLESASVSRQHAQILRDRDQFYVEDLHSRNGTFVNGQLIS
jgi:phosphoserine phosphatase RsbU/P